jgi:hypothetical protein
MTGRPHYHRCSECPASVLCTKQGEHPEPMCIKCRQAEREAGRNLGRAAEEAAEAMRQFSAAWKNR